MSSSGFWAMLFLTPVTALFLAWRTDRWQRPARWQRVIAYAVVFVATCFVTGLWVQSALADEIIKQVSDALRQALDPNPKTGPHTIWLLTSPLGTVVAWPTLLITSFVLRRIRRRSTRRRVKR